MQQQKKRGTNETSNSSYYKSRNNNWSGAAGERANNFSHQVYKANNKPTTNNIKSDKYIDPTGPFVLEAIPGLGFHTMIVACPPQADISRWTEMLASHLIAKIGTIACEVRGVRYINKKGDLPEEPVFPAGMSAALQKLRTDMYISKVHAHEKESELNLESRAQIIEATLAMVFEPLRLKLTKQFPNYLNEPQVIEFFAALRAAFAIMCCNGQEESIAQRILKEYADFNLGLYAFENAARNGGVFNPHEHYKEALKVIELLEVAKQPPLDEIAKVKLLLYSAETISHCKLPMAELKNNESKFNSLDKSTEEKRERADDMRLMPQTMNAAYEYLCAIPDLGIEFKQSKQAASMIQSSTLTKYEGGKNKQKNKGKSKQAETEDESLDKTKGKCGLCHGHHSADDCPDMHLYKEAWDTLAAVKKSKKIPIQKVNRQVPIESDSDEVDDMDELYNGYHHQKSSKCISCQGSSDLDTIVVAKVNDLATNLIEQDSTIDIDEDYYDETEQYSLEQYSNEKDNDVEFPMEVTVQSNAIDMSMKVVGKVNHSVRSPESTGSTLSESTVNHRFELVKSTKSKKKKNVITNTTNVSKLYSTVTVPLNLGVHSTEGSEHHSAVNHDHNRVVVSTVKDPGIETNRYSVLDYHF